MNIKKIANQLKRKYLTSNPFELAKCLNIIVIRAPLGKLAGCYMYKRRNRIIYINSDIEDEGFLYEVMAHEIGHAVLHRTENCYFIKNKTYLLTSKIEKQANKFASEFLIDDDILEEYRDYNREQLSRLFGYSQKLIELKFN